MEALTRCASCCRKLNQIRRDLESGADIDFDEIERVIDEATEARSLEPASNPGLNSPTSGNGPLGVLPR